jgi:pimeloyl-ACP methyl ester carboxylesterase
MIRYSSSFKNPTDDLARFGTWVQNLSALTQRPYKRNELVTPLGKTIVWSLETNHPDLPPLVIFPGYRTSSLFWDLDNGLDELIGAFSVYLVETNGQPNPSDGNTPDIRSDDYGRWALDLLNQLGLGRCYLAGASFGAMVCLKLCRVAHDRVQAVFLLNPGGFRNISFGFENLFYNVLPIISPSRKNILRFLDHVVFCKPNHALPKDREELLIDYVHLAISRFQDKGQKPYPMKDDLKGVITDVHLILGEKDILMPIASTIATARKYLPSLKAVHVLPETGHGIETDKRALRIIRQTFAGPHHTPVV